MAHRHFDPSRDAAALLHNAWMQPGERLIRYSPDSGSVRYKVRRRTGDRVTFPDGSGVDFPR